MNPIRVRVFRWDPSTREDPRYDAYDVPADGPLSVLAVLDHIYRHLDPTLAYRGYRCFLGVCTSCVVTVNGRSERACARLAAPGDELVIDPVDRSRVVRDLVVADPEGGGNRCGHRSSAR